MFVLPPIFWPSETKIFQPKKNATPYLHSTLPKISCAIDIEQCSLFCVFLGFMSIPLFTVYMVTDLQWPLGFFICNFWLQVDYALCYTSLLSIFLICIDRYWSVSNSVSSQTLLFDRKKNLTSTRFDPLHTAQTVFCIIVGIFNNWWLGLFKPNFSDLEIADIEQQAFRRSLKLMFHKCSAYIFSTSLLCNKFSARTISKQNSHIISEIFYPIFMRLKWHSLKFTLNFAEEVSI